jgi:hypothetical protein
MTKFTALKSIPRDIKSVVINTLLFVGENKSEGHNEVVIIVVFFSPDFTSAKLFHCSYTSSVRAIGVDEIHVDVPVNQFSIKFFSSGL